MLAAATSVGHLEETAEGGWWLRRWTPHRIAAGITNRRVNSSALLAPLSPASTIEAEQVHGSSIAIIERGGEATQVIPGCDALVTSLPGVALLIRTADCLPIFFAEPSRGVVGLAHVGWRGLMAQLPIRIVAAFRHAFESRASNLHVAIGPAIRTCCYEVGPEFAQHFGPFIQERGGRRTCDLVGMAIEQLRQAGIRHEQVLDTRHCTACDAQSWFSLRREGGTTGRLTSVIMVRP